MSAETNETTFEGAPRPKGDWRESPLTNWKALNHTPLRQWLIVEGDFMRE